MREDGEGRGGGGGGRQGERERERERDRQRKGERQTDIDRDREDRLTDRQTNKTEIVRVRNNHNSFFLPTWACLNLSLH